jgi:hypothetical protein
MRKNHFLTALVIAFNFLTVLYGHNAIAQSAAEFFKEKTISVLVGTNWPGGALLKMMGR